MVKVYNVYYTRQIAIISPRCCSPHRILPHGNPSLAPGVCKYRESRRFSMSDEREPTAAYYRKIAAQIIELANKTRLPEVRQEMFELAERFQRMAAHAERRERNRNNPPPQSGP
jgi:hypothetical protein